MSLLWLTKAEHKKGKKTYLCLLPRVCGTEVYSDLLTQNGQNYENLMIFVENGIGFMPLPRTENSECSDGTQTSTLGTNLHKQVKT